MLLRASGCLLGLADLPFFKICSFLGEVCVLLCFVGLSLCLFGGLIRLVRLVGQFIGLRLRFLEGFLGLLGFLLGVLLLIWLGESGCLGGLQCFLQGFSGFLLGGFGLLGSSIGLRLGLFSCLSGLCSRFLGLRCLLLGCFGGKL